MKQKYQGYSLDELGGIPFSWWNEIDVACDEFFRKRGMPLKGPPLKEIMEGQYQARRRQMDYEDSCYNRR